MHTSENPFNRSDTNLGITKFESEEARKLAFNRNRLMQEFRGDSIGEVILKLPLKELLSKINDLERHGETDTIKDAVEIQGESYDMRVEF